MPVDASKLKSPFAIARDKFIESDEGKHCADVRTLGGTDQYLRNRLIRAFEAGWNACEDVLARAGKER